MIAYHKSTGSIDVEPAREWCCIEGTAENTDNDAIDCAKAAYGYDWLMPVFVTRPRDWPKNPKPSNDGKKMLWLLVRSA